MSIQRTKGYGEQIRKTINILHLYMLGMKQPRCAGKLRPW